MSTAEANRFAALLRGHRLAAGFTQDELAERAGLSGRGIQDLERGVRRTPQPGTMRRLAEALRLEDAARVALFSAGQRVDALPDEAAPSGPAGSPIPAPLTSFIGREREVAEVTALLESTRLLTLTGVGGCGKTRLAIEVARTSAPGYAGGVRLVELAPLSDPSLVAQQVGTALGVRERPEQQLTAALIEALSGRHLLLMLDNCEHLLDACAVLADALLRGCPNLRALATSREPIGIQGEVAWRVPSLAVPDPEHAASVADIEDYPSVRLFVERARAAHAGFALGTANAPAVAQICRRLDGIPLALELAAARIPALSADQLAARLDQRFRLLTGGSRVALPRLQTLQATLDWSYALLSKAERRLLERLSVFAGQWTLEAGEAVGVGAGVAATDVVDVLTRLVRKSLVQATEAADGAERYALLETVRDYARQRLLARGAAETAATRERHARFYSAVAERLYPAAMVHSIWHAGGLAASGLRDELDELDDNMRMAVAWWSEVSRPTEGLRLVATLAEYDCWRGRTSEARRWLESMLDLADRAPAPSGTAERSTAPAELAARAQVLTSLGILTLWQGDYVQACARLEAAAALAREINEPVELNAALSVLGLTLAVSGAVDRAARILEECLALSHDLNDDVGATQVLRHLALAARWQTQYDRATALLRQALTHARQVHASRGFALARTVSSLGRVLYLRGVQQEAWDLLAETFGIIYNSRLGGQVLAEGLDWVAALLGARGDAIRAARLFGAAEAHWRASGMVRYTPDQPAYERDLASVRMQLDKHAFTAAWEEGQAMRAERAVAYVLEDIFLDGVCAGNGGAGGKPVAATTAARDTSRYS